MEGPDRLPPLRASRAYAQALAGAGAAVVVNDVDETAARAAADGIRDEGGQAVVGAAGTAESLVERAVADFGRLEVMVTNAGVLRDRVLCR